MPVKAVFVALRQFFTPLIAIPGVKPRCHDRSVKSTTSGLSAHPQNGANRSPEGSARYTADGTLMVKTRDGRWFSNARLVAENFAERCGALLPSNGVRIEITNPNAIRPATLMVKTRGGERMPLVQWMKQQRGSD